MELSQTSEGIAVTAAVLFVIIFAGWYFEKKKADRK